jgi:prephenate dehydratase
MTSYAFLGPRGTFTEAALRSLDGQEGHDFSAADLIPCQSVAAALDRVRAGESVAAMVPLENSVEGSVSTTLDELAFGAPLMIVREVQLPVTFALLVRGGTTTDDVKVIATHPHAFAQCRTWLTRNLPGARVVTAASTAAAAALVAGEDSTYDAAIAAPIAAEHYGLVPLATGIGDDPAAETRFVLVTRGAPVPPCTGADRTTVALMMESDHTGALAELLTEFTVRGVNMTRIESRPAGGALGRYYMSIDVDGHIEEPRVGEALAALHRVCAEVRFLGSYPRFDGASVSVPDSVTREAFSAADTWLARMRAGDL